MPKRIDYTGAQIGRIAVEKKAGINKDGRQLWKCRCECGHEYVTTSASLRLSRSCNRCKQLKDLTGARFGKLMVLHHQPSEEKEHLWVCACDCGNTAIYSSQSLLRHKARTCGCCSVTTFRYDADVGIGTTAAGEEFLFDMSDWNTVTNLNWHRTTKGYIVNCSGPRIALHRLVMHAPENVLVDHVNRNKADCRKKNLRIATNSENAANSATYKNNYSTGHKNVYRKDGLFRVGIRIAGKLRYFGYHAFLREAVRVANEKRLELFGEFAYYDDAFEDETGLLI